VVVFDQQALQTLGPREFVHTLARELRLPGLLSNAPPEAKSTEALSRWVRTDLPTWLAQRLADGSTRNANGYPAWVVMNTYVAGDRPLLWAEGLDEVVAALCGVRDANESAADITQLRWLFIASHPAALPLTGVSRCDEDLSREDMLRQDFINCFRIAWRSVLKDDVLDDPILGFIFKQAVAARHDRPVRKALAVNVREAVRAAYEEAGR